jgi:LTXXQ motif family protein
MQERIEAMIAAVETVQTPLGKFYDLLNDEQKARLTALGEEERKNSAETRVSGSLTESCGAAQPSETDWPTTDIDRRVRPTDAQRASLAALQDASAKAIDMLRASCQPDDALTPPARLTAVGKRLDSMLQAVRTVRSALDNFYGTLTDEQKAQFEAIGRQRTGPRVDLFERPKAARTRIPRHFAGIGSMMRQLLRIAP